MPKPKRRFYTFVELFFQTETFGLSRCQNNPRAPLRLKKLFLNWKHQKILEFDFFSIFFPEKSHRKPKMPQRDRLGLLSALSEPKTSKTEGIPFVETILEKWLSAEQSKGGTFRLCNLLRKSKNILPEIRTHKLRQMVKSFSSCFVKLMKVFKNGCYRR